MSHPLREVGHVWLLVPLTLSLVALAGVLASLTGEVP